MNTLKEHEAGALPETRKKLKQKHAHASVVLWATTEHLLSTGSSFRVLLCVCLCFRFSSLLELLQDVHVWMSRKRHTAQQRHAHTGGGLAPFLLVLKGGCRCGEFVFFLLYFGHLPFCFSQGYFVRKKTRKECRNYYLTPFPEFPVLGEGGAIMIAGHF